MLKYFAYLYETHQKALRNSAYYYDKWLKFLTQGRMFVNLVDVGCGTGPFIEYAHKNNWALVRGVDPNPHCVDFVNSGSSVPDVAIRSNILGLSLESQSADGVLCAHVLEHIDPERRQDAVDELFRIVRPGGRAVIVVPHPRPLWTYWDDITHKAPVTRRQLEILLRGAGFRVVRWTDDQLPGFKWMRVRPWLWPLYSVLLRLNPIRLPIAITAWAERPEEPATEEE